MTFKEFFEVIKNFSIADSPVEFVFTDTDGDLCAVEASIIAEKMGKEGYYRADRLVELFDDLEIRDVYSNDSYESTCISLIPNDEILKLCLRYWEYSEVEK